MRANIILWEKEEWGRGWGGCGQVLPPGRSHRMLLKYFTAIKANSKEEETDREVRGRNTTFTD